MLVGAAKRLSTGRAVGVDIWRAADLSGNTREATLANARAEGVDGRVEVRTADMRALPFPDATFDVVVSCAAIHNIDAADDRVTAIREIARVLKPGGAAIIDDIRNGRQYRDAFVLAGCDVRAVGPPIQSAVLAVVTIGAVQPATLVAIKHR
jgi:ubiquinone/menaquinone biosynthesis C-methylase UbiE